MSTIYSGKITRSGWLKAAVYSVLALAALWLALATTVTLVIGESSPQKALAWMESSKAQASLAEYLMHGPAEARDVLRARSLAQAALEKEPVNVAAARVLGLIADLEGDKKKARRLFLYANSLSRRDVATQIWLIEDSVQANNIRKALTHYDRAMRVSVETHKLLMPVLVQASTDPAIGGHVVELVAGRPPWWESFAERLIAEGKDPQVIFTMIRRLRLNPESIVERDLLISGMQRLVELEAYDRALALYDSAQPVRPGPGRPELLRDGHFDQPGFSIIPFDWSFANDPGFAGVLQPRAGQAGNALHLVSDSLHAGTAAQQLLVLEPGRYKLQALLGNIIEGNPNPPSIAMACAGTPGISLAELPLPAAPASGKKWQAMFTVPASSCRAQWIVVRTGSQIDRQGGSPWIDSITLHDIERR